MPQTISVLHCFQMLVFIIVLYVLGHLFFSIVRTKKEFFVKLSFYEKINYKIAAGICLIFFYFFIFSFFNFPFVVTFWFLFVITISIYLITNFKLAKHRYHFDFTRIIKNIKNIKIQEWVKSNFPSIVVFIILFYTVLLSFQLIMGYYGSTSDDAAWHTFNIRVLLDNPYALVSGSTKPFAEFYHTYPPIPYALGAMIVAVLGVPIEKVVILFTAILLPLIVLSFYSTTMSLFKNDKIATIAVIISCFFTTQDLWGSLGWGGLPFLLSVYISVTAIGFITLLLEEEKNTCIKYFLLGVTLCITTQTYPIAFLITSSWLLIVIVIKGLQKFTYRILNHEAIFPSRRALIGILAPVCHFLLPFCFSIPYFYRLYNLFFVIPHSNYPLDIPFNQLGAVAANSTLMFQQLVNFNWLLDISALSNFFSVIFGKLPALSAYSLLVIVILAIIYYLCRKTLPPNEKSILKNFSVKLLQVYLLFLMLMVYLGFLSSLYFGTIPVSSLFSVGRVFRSIFIFGVILSSAVLCFFIYSVILATKIIRTKAGINIRASMRLPKIGTVHSRRTSMLIIMLLLLSNGFILNDIYQRNLISDALPDFQKEITAVKSALETYRVIGYDDLLLMQSIRSNIPMESVILVSAGDAGQYLTSITQQKSIYEYSLRRFSGSYENLMILMGVRPGSPLVLKGLLDYNISYIFIGSKPVTYALEEPSRVHLDYHKLAVSPYFVSVFNFSDAWLFKFDREYALQTLDLIENLQKVYFFDGRYPSSWVDNLPTLFDELETNGFQRLDADQLGNWMRLQIRDETARSTTVVFTMGIMPDTVAETPSSESTIRKYLDAGGTVVWIGDMPFYYQGHNDGSLTGWGEKVSEEILGVSPIAPWTFPNYKYKEATITSDGVSLGMAIPAFAWSPVRNEEVSVVLSKVEGENTAESWLKYFGSTESPGCFIRYRAFSFDGNSLECNRDVISLAISTILKRELARRS